MLISVRWLSRHVNLRDLSAERIAKDLTIATAEVEGVEPFLPHAGQLLVGRVVDKGPHPAADRLSLCQVDVGEGEPVPVVCGAPNVAAGQNVALARPGVTLPGIGKLKKSKIRGQVSLGMICSEVEVGVGSGSDGIWVLPEGLQPGQTLAHALQLDDSVIDIDNKSLTHRPDLWGHRGIARELSAIYRRPLAPLDGSWPETGGGARVPVTLESEACLRYLALPIEGAQPLESPLWLRLLLAAVGQRSLGQLVDLSNFVMLDLGQPNHVFDRASLAPSGIVVGEARKGQPFLALDGSALELSSEDLLIGSGSEGIALAGVIGGRNSEVTRSTENTLLEVATFDATTIRRTSVRHGVRTDSSARFEKSLDPHLPALAAGHFARLLRDLQPSVTFPAPVTDAWPSPPKPRSINLRPERVRQMLGTDLPNEQIVDLLTRLGFGVAEKDGALLVSVPSDRATKDISMEADLVEEVGRLFGYGNIEERSLMAPVRPPPFDERRTIVRQLQDRLAGAAHFVEAIGYSLLSDQEVELWGLAEQPHARLENPVVAGESRVRRTLLPSLLRGIEHNRRLRDVVRLFEVGKGYFPEHSTDTGEPEERHLLGLAWVAAPPGRGAGFQQTALSQLHGVVHDLLRSLERPRVVWESGDAPPWAPSDGAIVGRYPDGSLVACLSPLRGEIHGSLGLEGRLTSDVAVCEVSIDAICGAPREVRHFGGIPKFPGIKVDVAVAVDASVPAGDVAAAIRSAAGTHCREVELFDLYVGEAVGAGRKSLAYHVLLQSAKSTLSEREEQKFLARLPRVLEPLGAQLRDG